MKSVSWIRGVRKNTASGTILGSMYPWQHKQLRGGVEGKECLRTERAALDSAAVKTRREQ